MTPQKFRKKPVVIEAIQWDGTMDRYEKIADWVSLDDGDIAVCFYGDKDPPFLLISTWENDEENDSKAFPGDWIVKGIKGEFYPVKDAIFRETYEEPK